VHTNLHLIYKLEPVTFDDGDPLEGSSSRVHINKCTDCIGYRGGGGGGGGERAVVVMPILMIMTWRTTDNHDS
jgi:hypothetical protein